MGKGFDHDGRIALPRVLVDPEAIAQQRQERRAAARHVASRARDATDCAQLLDALGLTPQDGLAG